MTTNKDDPPLFEALDTDPGSLLVSYFSNLHPLLVLSATSSSLSSLCSSSDAFLTHVSRRPRLAPSPFFSYFEQRLDAIGDHTALIEASLNSPAPLLSFDDSFGETIFHISPAKSAYDFIEGYNDAATQGTYDDRIAMCRELWANTDSDTRGIYAEKEALDKIRYDNRHAEWERYKPSLFGQRSQRDHRHSCSPAPPPPHHLPERRDRDSPRRRAQLPCRGNRHSPLPPARPVHRRARPRDGHHLDAHAVPLGV